MKRTIKWIAVLLVLLLGINTGCSKQAPDLKQITIAEQYGLAYAPLQIMKELRLLEKSDANLLVNWRQMGNTAAIREAMLAEEVDVGFMAIPPFLIGWDKGMEWKIAGGLSSSPVGLVSNRSEVSTIKDFTESDRIALPQPGSVQHILLSMACEKEFGDSHKLDNLLITMAHPEGMNALMAETDVTAHFTAPPYLTGELKSKENRLILSGEEVMGGEFTFIVGVATKSFHDENAEGYKAFIKALEESISFMETNKIETVEILSNAYAISKEEVEEYLDTQGVEYAAKVQGLDKFADFMKRNDYISKTPASKAEIMWDDVYYED
ncbi:MAG: ABC-type nitrate/sulfonate/bicarbonate transport system, periplasmic component [Clostridia bacterium]|jgi:NitT/TauT family transport system substrate-binding protein|nr:ABC-type nitrate/sulfonate/bicarbonate transport system, periplasmic component [Clostridia bacterium]